MGQPLYLADMHHRIAGLQVKSIVGGVEFPLLTTSKLLHGLIRLSLKHDLSLGLKFGTGMESNPQRWLFCQLNYQSRLQYTEL